MTIAADRHSLYKAVNALCLQAGTETNETVEWLRDLRKRAADLAEDMEGASKLLQHSSTRLTAAHYRTKPTKLKAVR